MAQYQDKSEHAQAKELNREAYADGCDLYTANDYASAKRSFESALEYCPRDAQSWFALGNCHDCMSQPEKSETCYLMSLKYSKGDAIPNVYYNLGNSLFDQGKYLQAVECYAAVTAGSSAHSAAQKNMVLAKKRLG